MNHREPLKTFKQLKTLYQHNTDFTILRDKLSNFHLFSNKNGLWDAYLLKDFLESEDISFESINLMGYDGDTAPAFILVKRSRTSFKFILFDTYLELQLNSGLSDVDVFKEVDKKWLKAHEKAKGRRGK